MKFVVKEQLASNALLHFFHPYLRNTWFPFFLNKLIILCVTAQPWDVVYTVNTWVGLRSLLSCKRLIKYFSSKSKGHNTKYLKDIWSMIQILARYIAVERS